MTLDPRVAARWDGKTRDWSVPRTPLPLASPGKVLATFASGAVLLIMLSANSVGGD